MREFDIFLGVVGFKVGGINVDGGWIIERLFGVESVI